MKIGLVKDFSRQFDGYNWHEEYASYCRNLQIDIDFLDFSQSNWLEQVEKSNANLYLWRAWHVPWDRDNAKRKIHFLENCLGKTIFPNWNMYFSYDDKIIQKYIMQLHQIPHPPTFVSNSLIESQQFAKKCSYPIVSKSSEGAMGLNVKLIDSQPQLEDHLQIIFSQKGLETIYEGRNQQRYVYLQKFIPSKRDLRIITIGNQVELAFWRESPSWRKNISQGGLINPNEIPQEALDLALDISKKLKMHWCAYDMIENQNEINVLEFSSIFGFSSVEYEKQFGHKNGNILNKQIQYLKRLYKNE